jgi:hypothetical protein
MELVRFNELKSKRGDEDEGPGTKNRTRLTRGKINMSHSILTGHRGDTIGGLRVLQVRLEVGNRVISKWGVHEVGAPGVLEESRFHEG